MNSTFLNKFKLFENKTYIFIFIFFLIINYFLSHSQERINDKLNTIKTTSDTVLTTKSEADTIVQYFGSSIEYVLDKKIINIYGSEKKLAKVVYKNMTLEAGKITVLLDSNIIIAEGIPDTTLKEGNNINLIATPILRQEKQEPFKGEKIIYNMKTKKGMVKEGRTKYEDGHYFGENITMVKEGIFQITNGYFTTCDNEEHPHFLFKGGKMKMKTDDKIVTKPIIVYIGDVPVFYLPFGVLPIRRGRHSGILFPTFGTSQVEGRFLRGLGYYFAPNDFMDTKFVADFFEKSGFFFRGDIRYSKRYVLSGNITGSITRKNFISGEPERPWDLQIDHRHQISPDMNFIVNGKFSSGKDFYRNFSLDRQYRSIRELISNATFNKNWIESKNSISINLRRRQDLELGNISETFPQISFNHTSPIYLFKRSETSDLLNNAGKEKWYNTINFRYNSILINQKSKNRNSETDPFNIKTQNGIQNSLNFLAPQTILKWLKLNPFLSYKEEWFIKTNKIILENNKLIDIEDKGFASRRIFNSGFTANTKIYGIFSPNIGNIKSIRHTITPSVSFSFQPDFSSKRFGYYEAVTDSVGELYRYDRFSGSIFGSTPVGKAHSMSISLQNLFQIKTLNGEKESKFDLFNLNLSTDYDFAREMFKFGNLITSFRTLSFLDIDVSSAHSFYRFDKSQNKVVNQLVKGFPRLLYFQTSSSFRITGSKEKPNVSSELTTEEKFEDTTKEDKQNRFIEDRGTLPMQIPWNLFIGFRYALNKYDPLFSRKTLSVTPKLDFNITKNWKINYNAEFDLISKTIIYHDFTFYRDLHCWEMRFDWTPSGARKGFFIIIRIKSPNFKDLKIEKKDYGGSVFGGRF